MAATRYQLLYRYINEATNTAITNNMANTYEKTQEFYTDEHKIESNDMSVVAEAEDEKEEMISYGNNPENPKNDMVFAYDGTKKIRHQKWVPEVQGCYVVRDWQSLDRNLIGNQGDFSKDFTTIGAESPEFGGTVVCKNREINTKYFPRTITVINDNSQADMGTASNPYYSESKMNSLITKATIFSLSTDDYTAHTSPSDFVNVWSSGPSYSKDMTKVYIGPVAIGANNMTIQSFSTGARQFGQLNDSYLYSSITIAPNQLQTADVPGHYEDVTSYPYVIKDTYKRILMSPWFVHATYGSLEAALEKAKILVDMIGIENVKLIKLVPFDQFVKIQ